MYPINLFNEIVAEAYPEREIRVLQREESSFCSDDGNWVGERERERELANAVSAAGGGYSVEVSQVHHSPTLMVSQLLPGNTCSAF